MTSSATAVAAATSSERTRAQTVLLAICLALGPAVAIGFGRFGYALILPAMRADLGWNYGQAGALNTANALGYLSGALLSAPVLTRVSNRNLLLCGLAASVGALFLAGATHAFLLLLACRALVGFSAAFTFIAATGLATRLGRDESENALAVGISISGPGMGTILTGLLVPFTLESGVSHWPRAWETMGVFGLLALTVVWASTRVFAAQRSEASPSAAEEKGDFKALWPILLAYFLFGLGYIAYMTFLVAYVRALQGSAATVAFIWTVLGVSMVTSTFLWRGALARNKGGQTLALMGFMGAASATLPLFSHALPVLLASAIGFGLASMPVFTAVTMILRRHLPIGAWNSAVAWATVIFAVGQSLGPIGSGKLSDAYGLSSSLYWTATIMTAASLVALLQKPKAAA